MRFYRYGDVLKDINPGDYYISSGGMMFMRQEETCGSFWQDIDQDDFAKTLGAIHITTRAPEGAYGDW